MSHTILIFISIFIFIGCKKDNIDVNSFQNCNNSFRLDSAATANKLSGSWLWLKQSCDGGVSKKADKNIKVTFNSIGTFSVMENTTVITQGNWKLELVNGNWELNTNSLSQYLDGRILFCDNQLLFSASNKDGCDNLFTKSN
jgi:hypothetical protein